MRLIWTVFIMMIMIQSARCFQSVKLTSFSNIVAEFSIKAAATSLQDWEGGSMLVVGDGDFSFTRSLAEKKICKRLVTSTLETKDAVAQYFEQARDNMRRIEELGAELRYEVDATRISDCVMGESFDIVLWNFPHRKGKQNIRYNRDLLKHFLISAKSSLTHEKESGGRVVLSLCEGQSGTRSLNKFSYDKSWKLIEQASEAGLLITNREPFPFDFFPGYYPQGHRGCGGSFPTGQAQLFTLQPPGGGRKAEQYSLVALELHLLGDHIIDDFNALEERIALIIRKSICSNMEYDLLHSVNTVDLYVCPESDRICYVVQLAFGSAFSPCTVQQVESMHERLEALVPSALSMSLRKKRRAGSIMGPYGGYVSSALSSSLSTSALQERLSKDLSSSSLIIKTESANSNDGEELRREKGEIGRVSERAFASAHANSSETIRYIARQLWRRKVGCLIHGE